jgi:hypothetical protein
LTSVSLDATVEPLAPGAGVPTGTVTFKLVPMHKKSTLLGTLKLDAGSAALRVNPADLGGKSITVLITYSGCTDFQPVVPAEPWTINVPKSR